MVKNKDGEELWFDVEKRYNTTCPYYHLADTQLWFDVEKRYNTTKSPPLKSMWGCGLM